MVMSRNDQAHFSQVPNVDIQRSRFQRDSRLLTTMNAGKLIPIFVDECLPGDTLTMDTASLVRMSTPIFPVMDNCYMDVYYFFVPNRLVWEHWKEFNGENNSTYWTQPTEYNVPQIWCPNEGWNKGSLADYFGLPTGVSGDFSVSALPFRAYVNIWNEFFRDQNYMSPAYFNKTDNGGTGMPATGGSWDGILNALYGGDPLPVAKYHDYFTSVLPAPQKGEPMELPFFHDEKLPVGALPVSHDYGGAALKMTGSNGITSGSYRYIGIDSIGDATVMGSLASAQNVHPASPENLWADMTGVTAGTINELRQAFQIQKLLEKDARGGTRYTEILHAHFGVTSPDGRLQRPEYLGGKRIPINVDQVIQTSATNSVSPQGNTAAFSLTTDVSSSFTKSFTEHGWVIGVACIRTDHTYQQGIDKMWSRKRRFDFYWPTLANISEQPVLRKEIFVSDVGPDVDEQVFGYQEAWAEYRYKPSRVSGAFRSQYAQSLDSWHYADYFGVPNDNPFIADRDFMAETFDNIDRTLAVQSDLEDQFLCNFFFESTWTRPMPLYSVPGMIDHF